MEATVVISLLSVEETLSRSRLASGFSFLDGVLDATGVISTDGSSTSDETDGKAGLAATRLDVLILGVRSTSCKGDVRGGLSAGERELLRTGERGYP